MKSFVLAATSVYILCLSQLTAGPTNFTIHSNGKVHTIELETTLDSKKCSVLKAITDYDNLSQFYSNLSKSKILQVRKDHVVVDQTFIGQIMNIFVQQKVVLKISSSGNQIIMEQIEGDFVSYKSKWSIWSRYDKTHLKIQTVFELSFFKNLFLTQSNLKKKYTLFLKNLKHQIKTGNYEQCK